MAIFETNLRAIEASEEEVELYYQASAKTINLLLAKYNIRNTKDQLEEVSADSLKALLSFSGFFQSTPLKLIFYDQKQQFVPEEIVYAFRSILSEPPLSIKAIFFNTFITLLIKKGWDKSLSTYFEKQYSIPQNSIVILDDLKDFSLGFGVYKATFQLSAPHEEKIVVFLKKSFDMRSYNELLYFCLQKELLPTASNAKMPYLLTNKENKEELLLSPLIPGVTSDITLTILTHTHRNTKSSFDKLTLKKSLEMLIEAFISHAVLGDLLGRNDRHLMNSLLDEVIDGVPQNTTLEDLIFPERILAYAKNIVTNKSKAISLIDFDLKWLLGGKNADWALADIDFGLSELNLLSLLTDFNDFNSKTNPFFEKRKEYIAHYFKLYSQQLETILDNKELLFSAIKNIYPSNISDIKLQILSQRISLFKQSKDSIVNLFKRYLFNFRIRLIHKDTLIALNNSANQSNNIELLNELNKASLLKYLPAWPTVISYDSSVFLQLQCFRGVLSKKDMDILSIKDGTSWEVIASNISMIAEKFNSKLFEELEKKKQFIEIDAVALLSGF